MRYNIVFSAAKIRTLFETSKLLGEKLIITVGWFFCYIASRAEKRIRNLVSLQSIID